MTDRIVLARRASWNKNLRVRECRYVEAGGRHYRATVHSTRHGTSWDVELITESGDWVDWVAVYARNQEAVRTAIALHVAGASEDTIRTRMCTAPGSPTGRNARRT